MSTKKSINTNPEFSKKTIDNILSDIKRNMLWLSNNIKVSHDWLGIDIRDEFIKEPVCYVCVKDYKGKLHFGQIGRDTDPYVLDKMPLEDIYYLYIDYAINRSCIGTVIEIYYKEVYTNHETKYFIYRHNVIGETEKVNIVNTCKSKSLRKVNFDVKETLVNRVESKDTILQFGNDKEYLDAYHKLKSELLKHLKNNLLFHTVTNIESFGKLMSKDTLLGIRRKEKVEKVSGTLEEYVHMTHKEATEKFKAFMLKTYGMTFLRPRVIVDLSNYRNVWIFLTGKFCIGIDSYEIKVNICDDKNKNIFAFKHRCKTIIEYNTNSEKFFKRIINKTFRLLKKTNFNAILKTFFEKYTVNNSNLSCK